MIVVTDVYGCRIFPLPDWKPILDIRNTDVNHAYELSTCNSNSPATTNDKIVITSADDVNNSSNNQDRVPLPEKMEVDDNDTLGDGNPRTAGDKNNNHTTSSNNILYIPLLQRKTTTSNNNDLKLELFGFPLIVSYQAGNNYSNFNHSKPAMKCFVDNIPYCTIRDYYIS